MPDKSLILVREIKNALNGRDFKYIPSGEIRQRSVPGLRVDQWVYYFKIFKYYLKFGMPHGDGWATEQPWLIDFLCFMDDVHSEVVSWNNSRTVPGDGSPDIGSVLS